MQSFCLILVTWWANFFILLAWDGIKIPIKPCLANLPQRKVNDPKKEKSQNTTQSFQQQKKVKITKSQSQTKSKSQKRTLRKSNLQKVKKAKISKKSNLKSGHDHIFISSILNSYLTLCFFYIHIKKKIKPKHEVPRKDMIHPVCSFGL